MPFKSEAQRRKFGEMVAQGQISQSVFDEWNADTPENLPERIAPKKKPAAAARTKRPSGSDPRLAHVGLALRKKQK